MPRCFQFNSEALSQEVRAKPQLTCQVEVMEEPKDVLTAVDWFLACVALSKKHG
jgi:hypothetical protein